MQRKSQEYESHPLDSVTPDSSRKLSLQGQSSHTGLEIKSQIESSINQWLGDKADFPSTPKEAKIKSSISKWLGDDCQKEYASLDAPPETPKEKKIQSSVHKWLGDDNSGGEAVADVSKTKTSRTGKSENLKKRRSFVGSIVKSRSSKAAEKGKVPEWTPSIFFSSLSVAVLTPSRTQ